MSVTGRRASGTRRGPRALQGLRRKPGRLLAILAVAAVVVLGTISALNAGTGAPDPSSAVTLPSEIDARDFDPGLVVSDYNFYNAAALSAAEVQTFLEDQSCRPSDGAPCLERYRESTVSQPDQGDGHCAAYQGAPRERASTIISRVADACQISPKVLLVLLQKEQSLLTTPNESGYLRATGYGCPDTADCNADYFGFFNQVYNAAWQFRQYSQEPDREYQIGTVDVGYHPNADCGSSRVKITNQATANLYNYTPYQPSPKTIAGAADACSTYGNLNFWSFYTQWFGDSDSKRYPDFLDPCLNLVGGQPCRAGTPFG